MTSTERHEAHYDVEAARKRIRKYFFGEDEQGSGWPRVREQLKYVTIGTGLLLLLAAAALFADQGYRLWKEGAFASQNLDRFALPAGLLVVGGVILAFANRDNLWDRNHPWRVFLWLLVMPLMLLLVAAWLTLEDFASEWWRNIGGSGAFLAAVGGFFFTREASPPVVQIEREIDALFEQDVERHCLRVTRPFRPAAEMTVKPAGADDKALLLRGYPEGSLSAVPLKIRPGQDGRPRITPHGFLALILGRDAVLSFEGAIDLTSGELLYQRTREFLYRDITVIALESIAIPLETKGTSVGKKVGQALPIPGIRQPVRSRDVFSIGLPGGTSVAVVVRDSNLFDARRNPDVQLLSSIDDIGEAWRTLSLRRRAALSRGGPTA